MELWIALNDIPAEGREFHFSDQSLWTGPLNDFHVLATPARDFEAHMTITPQDDGFLVSGSFSGAVRVVCGRCAVEFELPLAGEFDGFETLGGDEADVADESRLRLRKGQPEFDAAGFLWEQFMLALPENPVCAEDCQGLCPSCGADRNKDRCACAREEGDPRLAVLRNLKLS